MTWHTRSALGRAGLATGIAVGLLGVATNPATGATSLSVDDHATLQARGAAVTLDVDVACDPIDPPPPFPVFSFLPVTVAQRCGSRTVGGGAGTPVTCDGTVHTVTVSVIPSAFDIRRRWGVQEGGRLRLRVPVGAYGAWPDDQR